MLKKTVKIQLVKNQAFVAEKCVVADSFFSRLKGLIGTRKFETGQGLLLRPCNEIHMWMMSISIDVVFVKSHSIQGRMQVTSLHRNLRPWKAFPVGDRHATGTLELPTGVIDLCSIQEGDELCIS